MGTVCLYANDGMLTRSYLATVAISCWGLVCGLPKSIAVFISADAPQEHYRFIFLLIRVRYAIFISTLQFPIFADNLLRSIKVSYFRWLESDIQSP